MLAPPGELLRAGLELKLNRIKRATQSYMRDRLHQATGTATSYAVATGLLAVAGIFLMAACGVGLTALFRWVEIGYGEFPAFAVVGGLLVVLAVISGAIAMMRLRRPAPNYPSLASRLRVAIASPVLRSVSGGIDPAAIPLAPSAPSGRPRAAAMRRSGRAGLRVPVGVAVTGLLLGWVALRRRHNRRLQETPPQPAPARDASEHAN